MLKLLAFISLLGAGWSQTAPLGVAEEMYNIFYGLPISFQDCSNIQVDRSQLIYTLYTQDNPQTGTVLTDSNLDIVNSLNRIILLIHGWLQNGKSGWVIEMKDTYLKQGPANVITLDWSNYSVINYGAAVCAVPQVGNITGNLICNLTLDLSKVQCNGFSLGAHVAGFAGKKVQNVTGGEKIQRIIGLDAAGPGYEGHVPEQRLSSEDAVDVQALHSSVLQFGYSGSYGTEDFYLNCNPPLLPFVCGAFQPCCPIDPGVPTSDNITQLMSQFFCNHIRVCPVFTESINSNNFLAVRCSCDRFGIGLCRSNPTTVMGEHCPLAAGGVLFLNTNGVSLYAKGKEGTGGTAGLGGAECLASQEYQL